MSNPFDYAKLSTFVNSLIERKTRALAISVSTSTGFLRALTNQAASSAQLSADKAAAALLSADNAQIILTNTTNVFENFSSIYLGVKAADPTKSASGKSLFVGAFYIRTSDRRLRSVTAVTNNIPTWEDASVAADRDSVIAICDNRYLNLDFPTQQIIKGRVSFAGETLVPVVTDWTTRQAVGAKDVKDRIDTVNGNITTVVNYVNDLAAKTITGNGLITGSGRNDQNRVLTVAPATVSQVREGTSTSTAVTPQALHDAGAVYIVASGQNENGYFRSWSDGTKECWGAIGVPAQSTVTVTLPVAHSSYCIPSGTCSINQDEASIGALNPSASGFQLRNRNPMGTTFYWHTKGV